ncbi:tetratricopeptide repeat protein [Ancylobacter oerskovii]|uniref:Tetratricopeptide repeat protein n=1 Tax=Ancylobacter oerskovii TaxID=459519 RepID=A0ABW4Z3Z5_9HYPH|nr:tetratricopeptide repeat protein [Ancylobacter oerskovii]MBS7545900.1 tetratricopeptide repeat protein [Ancylobacter oerskovii]
MSSEPTDRFSKAKALIAAGQPGKAEPLLRQILKSSPGKPTPLMMLAELRRKAGDREEATTLFRRLWADGSGPSKAGLSLARLLIAAKAQEEAETVLRQVLEAVPDQLEARLLLVDLRRRQRDQQDAEALLQQGWSLRPGEARLGLPLVEILMARRALPEAEAVLRPLLDAPPDDLDILLQLAELRRRQGDTAEAESLLRQGRTRHPSNAAPVLELSHLFARTGKADEAEAVLVEALEASPEHPGLLVALGRRQSATHRDAEAMQTFERAIATPDSPTDAWLGLANAAGRLVSTRLALEKLAQALAAKNDDPAVHFALANHLLHIGCLPEAEMVASAAIARFPGDTDLRTLAFRLELATGRHEDALASLARLPDKTRKDHRLRTRLRASLLKGQWRVDEARDLYRTGKLPEMAAPEYRLLADIHLMALDVVEARNCLREVNRRTPQRRSMNVSQGLAGEILNDFWTDTEALAAGQAARRQDTLGNWVATVNAHRHHTGCAVGFMIHLRQSGRFDAKPVAPDLAAIPRHIHQFWDTPEIPDDVMTLMGSWRAHNPGWSYTLHSLDSTREWLRQVSDTDLLRAFRRMPTIAGKVDLLRLAVLFAEGGVYADADDRCLGSLDAVLAGRGLVLRQEHYGSIGNNFIAVRPGHPVIGRALEEAVEAVLRGDRESIWLSTGPGLMTRILATYLVDDPTRIDTLGGEVLVLDQPKITGFCVSGCRVTYKHTDRNWQAREFQKLPNIVRTPAAMPAGAPGRPAEAEPGGRDGPTAQALP